MCRVNGVCAGLRSGGFSDWLAPFTGCAITRLSRSVHASWQRWFWKPTARRETVAGVHSSIPSLQSSSGGCVGVGPRVGSLLPESPFQKAFTSRVLCNCFPVPAPILAAQVTGGLQEPFEIKEQHLKGHGHSPEGLSACSSTAAKSAMLGWQGNPRSWTVKARPGKAAFSRFEAWATQTVICLRLQAAARCKHGLLPGVRTSVLLAAAGFQGSSWLLMFSEPCYGGKKCWLVCFQVWVKGSQASRLVLQAGTRLL